MITYLKEKLTLLIGGIVKYIFLQKKASYKKIYDAF